MDTNKTVKYVDDNGKAVELQVMLLVKDATQGCFYASHAPDDAHFEVAVQFIGNPEYGLLVDMGVELLSQAIASYETARKYSAVCSSINIPLNCYFTQPEPEPEAEYCDDCGLNVLICGCTLFDQAVEE